MQPCVAALYVDVRRGPYAAMPGVQCWGVDENADTYDGDLPVVAHPPCGHWGRYWYKAHDDGRAGPLAVAQVRRVGGVLEHPRDSRLWRHCGLPLPGWLGDNWGGFTLEVFQRDWGHRADKPTWLYVCGVPRRLVPLLPAPAPPREIRQTQGGTRGELEKMSKTQRHLTPPPFAAWLVQLAKLATR